MNATRQFVKDALGDVEFPLFTGPLLVIAHFKLPAPLSKKEWKRSKQHMLPHTKRPDGDNLEKFLNDSLNGTLWDDDARIAWLVRSKSYTNARVGETVLFVRELGNAPPDYQLIASDIQENIKL